MSRGLGDVYKRQVTDIESTLMKTGKFRIPGKKALLKDSDYPEFVVMDVTETAIERPKKTENILLR